MLYQVRSWLFSTLSSLRYDHFCHHYHDVVTSFWFLFFSSFSDVLLYWWVGEQGINIVKSPSFFPLPDIACHPSGLEDYLPLTHLAPLFSEERDSWKLQLSALTGNSCIQVNKHANSFECLFACTIPLPFTLWTRITVGSDRQCVVQCLYSCFWW